jgi:phosphoribosyl 1,2-cyclic phosphate phosphodiesterase
VHIESPEISWVIDTGADFRSQCLRERIRKVQAAVYTHPHTDHIMGFDDLRAFAAHGEPFPVYGSEGTLQEISRAFSFAFHPKTRIPGYLHPEPRPVSEAFFLGKTELLPLPLPHGNITSQGYLLSREGRRLFAYLTDCHAVPKEVVHAVEGVEHLVVDALRERPHPTHMNVGAALEVIDQVRPQQGWLTHLCHDLRHSELEARLPSGVRVAFDGLRLSV